MNASRRVWARVGAVAALLVIPGVASAQKTAADLLPASTLAYVEVRQPADVLALIDGKLGRQIQQSDPFRQAVASPKFKEFRSVVGVVETRAGTTWPQAFKAITSGGVVAAFDSATQGVVILARPADLQSADAVRDALFSLVREDAKHKGNPDPIQSRAYRGIQAYTIGEATIADVGPWVIVSNKPMLAKAVADRFLDGGRALAGDKEFLEAHDSADRDNASPAAWAFLRLGTLRFLGRLAHQPLLDPKCKSDNPVLELIAGGLLPVLQNSPYVTATVSTEEHGLKLVLATPSDSKWTTAPDKFYFAPPGAGALKPLEPRGTVLALSTYRDLSAMWQSSPDLFTEDIAAKLAQADSGLSTIFGGRQFSSDVLGAIKPQIQFIVARQDYRSAGVAEPTVRIPSAALVLGIRPERFDAVRRDFRVGFQTAVALANLNGAQKGRPLLEMQTEKRSGAQIMYATYDQPDKASDKSGKSAATTAPAAPADDMYLNFSPALAISDKHMILSSTRQLAEELADLAARQDAQGGMTDQNTVIEVNAVPAAELLADNREQLVAKNMLEKGHDRAHAEKETDLLQTIVEAFQDVRLRLVPASKSIRLELDVRTAP